MERILTERLSGRFKTFRTCEVGWFVPDHGEVLILKEATEEWTDSGVTIGEISDLCRAMQSAEIGSEIGMDRPEQARVLVRRVQSGWVVGGSRYEVTQDQLSSELQKLSRLISPIPTGLGSEPTVGSGGRPADVSGLSSWSAVSEVLTKRYLGLSGRIQMQVVKDWLCLRTDGVPLRPKIGLGFELTIENELDAEFDLQRVKDVLRRLDEGLASREQNGAPSFAELLRGEQ